MQTLQAIWDELNAEGHGSDKGDIHSYLPVYEELFASYRQSAFRVMEIGVFKGDSLRLWERYFSEAYVHGIDCSDQPHGGMADLRPMIASGDHLIHIMDGENEKAVMDRFSGEWFDIIIDDAGHNIEQQLNLMQIWLPLVRIGGLYVIEDIQNINEHRDVFRGVGEVIDLRHIKNRYDDVLIIIRK